MQLFVLLSILFACNFSFITIPPSPPGRSLGDPYLASTVMLEMFVDWQCSFSRKAWGTMEQVLKHYGNQVHFVFHVTCLWLFRQSANLAVAAEIIAEYGLKQPSDYWKLVSAMYAIQPNFYNDVFYNKTEADEYKMLAAFALQYGVDNNTFYSNMGMENFGSLPYAAVAADNTFCRQPKVKTVLKCKIGKGQKRRNKKNKVPILQTPTFRVNGVIDPTLTSQTNVSQWINYIDTIFDQQAMKMKKVAREL